ncbi:MAG: DPP IV N-terminal domain-containing protein [Gemmatimonadetes bacterium]|nr:DPP IV N-terminal domain-containing protein [Gemmatimonadota bacterium]
MRRAIFSSIAALFLAGAAQAQIKTIVTDHFRVHYTLGAEGTARRVAETCEEVFPTLAAAYDYYDDFRTIHVIVLDNSDVLGNGWANYYSNTMAIWATSLDFELRGSHDWIKNVVTHELTHIMTLNKARKKWPFQFALISVSRFDSNPDIAFQFPLYHLNAPRGWTEGIAQYGAQKFGYDTWDSHRDMLLRMAVLEDDLLSWEEMGTVWDRMGKFYGEFVYNQGYAMMVYIHEQYGAEKVDELTHQIGSMSFDPAIRRVLGVSADQFYADWVAFLAENYGRLESEIRGQGFFQGAPLDEVNEGVLEYHPALSPDGKKLAYLTSEKRDYGITVLKIYDFETRKKIELKGWIDTRIGWSPDGEEIVFVRNKGGFNDLYIYNLAEDKEHRISARLRAKDPSFSPDGQRIAFVHNEDGTNNLGLIDRDGTDLVYLTNNNDATQYMGPRFSPDGEWLLFSLFRGEDRDIAMIRADSPPRPKVFEKAKKKSKDGENGEDGEDEEETIEVFPDTVAFAHPDSSGFRAVVASPADERDPHWLPDGSGFVFSSDQSGIFNIYRYRLENDEVEQLTNVIGGAFVPTVAADERVVYSGYHSNDYSLYSFEIGEFERDAHFEPVAMRDYRSIFDGPKIADQFQTATYRGRNVLRYIPILQVGPTYVGNTFGLNQASGGLQFSTGDMFGGQELTAWGIVGKNMRNATDLNTDVGFFYERRLRPQVGNNRTFNPSFYIAGRRREIDNLIKDSQITVDTLEVGSVYPVPVDSVTSLLIPDVRQYIYQGTSREDLFKTSLGQLAVGVDVPLTRRTELNALYIWRDYAEGWTLRRFRSQNQIYLEQDGVDISASLDPSLLAQDTLLVNNEDPLEFYEDLSFFRTHMLSMSWRYQKINPTADRLISPSGRAMALVYRYLMPTVADSLTEQIPTDGVPRDQFVGVERRLRVNEYIAAYNERIKLPFDNSLNIELIGAYKNVRLKPRFIEDGGFFEGRFYWPLRYYIGGRNFLSGYPYFTDSGTKLLYARVGYGFPILKRISSRFINFNFSKLYAELFAEAGVVGNFSRFEDIDFWSGERWRSLPNTDEFLTNVGGELRLQLFTFYRIPMFAYFQVAHPLNRDRVSSGEDAPLIDKWRYYFGFGL